MQMEQTIHNPQKGRRETIDVVLTDENTTWFNNCTREGDIYSITDFKGGLLIKEYGYTCPIWVYDLSRADIGYNQKRAKGVLKELKECYK
jgi:hypothetical protein